MMIDNESEDIIQVNATLTTLDTLQAQSQEHQFKMASSVQDSELQRYNSELDAEISREHSEAEHSVKLEQMKKMSAAKAGAKPGGEAGPKKAEKKPRPA